MSALLEKMNSLPKSTTAVLGDDDAGAPEAEGNENDLDTGSEETSKPETKKPVVEKDVQETSGDEDKEPPKTAPKAERDAYKQRKLKQADEEKTAAKADAARLKQELEEARKEKEEWKKQAQRNTAPSNPAPTATPAEKSDPAADLAKDPVAFLAKGLDEANKRINSFENEKTVNAASAELADLETKYKTEKASDYDDVMKHAEDAEVAKMKVANPNANEASIRKGFKDDKLKAAVMFLAQGRDPVEGLYQLAKTGYGYQPKSAPADPKTTRDELDKKKFDAVNKNKNKSATGLSAGGHTGEVEVRGPATTKKRTLRDFASLTKEQKDADYIAE